MEDETFRLDPAFTTCFHKTNETTKQTVEMNFKCTK